MTSPRAMKCGARHGGTVRIAWMREDRQHAKRGCLASLPQQEAIPSLHTDR